MKTTLITFLLLLAAIADTHAQYHTNRNKVWAFGRKAGLDFTSGSPVPIGTSLVPTSSISEFSAGSASVCDTAGHLLFYTNGKQVYNRHHALMPAGAAIVPFATNSAAQAAVIVPVIDSAFQYYLFSLEQAGAANSCRLAYSIIDMTLDGGNGDVVIATAGTPLADTMSDKMIAIAGTNHNIWLLTHSRDTGLFYAYEITGSGIDTVPVISSVGTFSGLWCYVGAVLKASPNGRKIVSQSPRESEGTELYDFDPATGIVSNCIVLDTVGQQYGAEFSPDNTKLYTQHTLGWIGNDTMRIYQYNVALGSPAAIRSSKTLIPTDTNIGACDLKLAPDHKIYFSGRDDSAFGVGLHLSRYFDCIASPNLAGTACGYIPHVIKLPDSTGIYYGLPNVVIDAPPASSVAIGEVATPPAQGITNFPNPASTQLTITSNISIAIGTISISNLLGQVLHHSTHTSPSATIDISSLPPGIYCIRTNTSEMRRFVKE